MTPNNFRIKNGLTVSNGVTISAGNVVITSGQLVIGATAINATSLSDSASNAYTNAITIAANASNLTSGTVAFARLPSLFVGTTTIQSTSAAQAVSGITTLAAGNTTITGDMTVSGNLTINGTTTNINSTNLVVEDKNIVLADVTTPTDVTADGGGITLKGATDKTLNWVDATDSWTSSEHIDLAAGKVYKIGTTTIANSTALGTGILASSLTSVGTLSSLTLGGALSGVTTAAMGNTTITGFANVSTTLQVGTNTATFGTAAYLVANGNLGLGTSTPLRPLHAYYNSAVVGAYSAILQGATGGYGAGVSFQSQLTGGAVAEMARITGDGDSAWNTTASTQDASLRFYTALDGTVAEKMRLNSAGQVGIGNTTPSHLLSVNGTTHLGGTVNIVAGSVLTWNSDVGISRSQAAVLSIGNGTQNDSTGTISLTGGLFTGAVNAASHTVGSSFIANTTGVTTTGFANVSTTLQVGGITTLAANLVMANNNITRPILTGYTEHEIANTAATGSYSLDCGAANFFDLTLTGNITISPTNVPPATRVWSGTIAAKQDATGGRTITWPAGTKYAGGVSPPATTTANAVDIWSIMTYDGGTTYIVSLSVKGAA